jgi:hypothetical protein
MTTELLTIGLSVALSFALFAFTQWRGWFVVETKEVADLRKQIDNLTDDRNRLLLDLANANRRIQDLERELGEIKAHMSQNRPHLVVLGVWPGSNLSTSEERDAIYDAGVEYRALFGDRATRANILRELRIGGITVLEIGAHGNPETLLINEHQLTGGWWQRVLTGRSINVAVILACFSDSSVADAMKRAGVQHVVAATEDIEDAAAVEFARQFYQLYAAGMDVPRAFDEAKLALDYRQAEKLVLR